MKTLHGIKPAVTEAKSSYPDAIDMDANSVK